MDSSKSRFYQILNIYNSDRRENLNIYMGRAVTSQTQASNPVLRLLPGRYLLVFLFFSFFFWGGGGGGKGALISLVSNLLSPPKTRKLRLGTNLT